MYIFSWNRATKERISKWNRMPNCVSANCYEQERLVSATKALLRERNLKQPCEKYVNLTFWNFFSFFVKHAYFYFYKHIVN